jgi:hypothetical protein
LRWKRIPAPAGTTLIKKAILIFRQNGSQHNHENN